MAADTLAFDGAARLPPFRLFVSFGEDVGMTLSPFPSRDDGDCGTVPNMIVVFERWSAADAMRRQQKRLLRCSLRRHSDRVVRMDRR